MMVVATDDENNDKKKYLREITNSEKGFTPLRGFPNRNLQVFNKWSSLAGWRSF